MPSENKRINMDLQKIVREYFTVTVYLSGMRRLRFSLWLMKIACKIGGFNFVQSNELGILITDKGIVHSDELTESNKPSI